ncbi:hypothetical protein ACH4LE_23840 [Streptomyces sp. NPDC017413]|uniref:hypothetical protein n=1 Tax=Streptomyces sp. NPDC017413 TaxID=3364994 RepID=UPI0037AED857
MSNREGLMKGQTRTHSTGLLRPTDAAWQSFGMWEPSVEATFIGPSEQAAVATTSASATFVDVQARVLQQLRRAVGDDLGRGNDGEPGTESAQVVRGMSGAADFGDADRGDGGRVPLGFGDLECQRRPAVLIGREGKSLRVKDEEGRAGTPGATRRAMFGQPPRSPRE